MDHLIGDTVYFDALTPLGRELMAYNLLNHTSWLVADLEQGMVGSNPGEHMSLVVGHTLLFDTADDSLWGGGGVRERSTGCVGARALL